MKYWVLLLLMGGWQSVDAQNLHLYQQETIARNAEDEDWKSYSRNDFTRIDSYDGFIDSQYVYFHNEELRLSNIREVRFHPNGESIYGDHIQFIYANDVLDRVSISHSEKSFNQNGQLVECYFMSGNYDAVDQRMIYLSANKYVYQYDSNGCLKMEKRNSFYDSNYEAKDWIVDPQTLSWSPATQYTYTTDEQCQIQSDIFSWLEEDGSIASSKKRDYTYDGQGEIIQSINYNWDALLEVWALQSTVDYEHTYHNNDLLESTIEYLDGAANQRTHYHYNQNNLLTRKNIESYSEATGWELISEDTTVYDAEGQVLNNFVGKIVDDDYLETNKFYEYSPEGWITFYQEQNIEDDLVNQERLEDVTRTRTYSYDCAGNLIDEYYLIEVEVAPYFSPGFRFESQTKNVYHGLPFCDEAWPDNQGITIYPNPSTGTFFVDSPLLEAPIVWVKVFDLQGREVYADQIRNPYGSFILFLSGLPTATYQVVLQTESDRETSLIVIGE